MGDLPCMRIVGCPMEIEFFVAPTEPKQMKELAADGGQITLLPEKHGVDVCWWGKYHGEDALWGVQRKELKDLLASVTDGRLAREVAQMKGSIPLPIVFIEGKIQFDLNGNLVWNSWGQEYTRAQFKGILWSLMHEGVHIEYTKDVNETVNMIRLYAQWSQKLKHTSIMKRPTPFNPWGKPGNVDYEVHLLQGFDVLGQQRAKDLIKHFGGVPLQWTVTEQELMKVPGIGKKIAQSLMAALPPDST